MFQKIKERIDKTLELAYQNDKQLESRINQIIKDNSHRDSEMRELKYNIAMLIDYLNVERIDKPATSFFRKLPN